MADIIELLEEGGIIGGVLIVMIILFRLAQRAGLNMKCGLFSIDLRRPQTKQKQLKYDSIQEMQKLKNEELTLRIKDKELQLDIIKEKRKDPTMKLGRTSNGCDEMEYIVSISNENENENENENNKTNRNECEF